MSYWAKMNLMYDLQKRTNGQLWRIESFSLRYEMMRLEEISNFRRRVADMTRAGDEAFLKAAAWFAPGGALTKLRYLKYAANLVNWKRGAQVTLKVSKTLLARNSLREAVIGGGSDIISQAVNHSVDYLNSSDPNKGNYLDYVGQKWNVWATAGNTVFKNALTTSALSTIGDGNIKALPGNLIGDAIGNIPITKSMGSGFNNGASFTLGLWGNQVGNTVTNIIDPKTEQ